MRYVKVAETNELKDGEKKKVTLDGTTILLVKIDGAYYALDNKCPHMGGSLYDGNFEGGNIKCPRHGTVFDVRTGRAVKGGKIAFINLKVGDAKAYQVKTEGSDVLVGLE